MNKPIKNIAELFLSAAASYPDNVAIIDANRSITYAALQKEVKATAAYFQQKGIQNGDRVLVFVPMGVDLYRIVLALFYMGATAVFLDEWVSKKRLEVCCELADCKGFVGVFKARVFAFFSSTLRKIPIKLSLKKQLNPTVKMAEMPADSAALITFTTGSTGVPKAARRTHEFLNEQFNVLLDEIKPSVTDIDMPILPIVLFVNLGVGCTSVIADFKMTKPELMKPSRIIEQIEQHNVNRIIASPFFIKKIAEYGIAHKVDFQTLKKVFTGGAPVFPTEAALYQKAFAHSKSTIVYGSTEAEPISTIEAAVLVNLSNEMSQGLPVGNVYHKTNVKIIQITTESIVPCTVGELNKRLVAPEKIGEIIVSGTHVLAQYFKNEQAFRENKIIVDGVIWHRTGDSGFMKNKTLFLTGRCQQLISKSGKYLSPFIIENQLQDIEGVKTGTLLSIENQLVLVLESKLNETQLAQQVANISYDTIKIIPKIPMDPRHNSKIDYGKLKEVIA